MEILVDDARLTRFLVACIKGTNDGSIHLLKPGPGQPVNEERHKHTEGDLTFLQSVVYNTETRRSRMDIRVVREEGEVRKTIWCLDIQAVMHIEPLDKYGVSHDLVRRMVGAGRYDAYDRALAEIDAGKKGFSIFKGKRIDWPVKAEGRTLNAMLTYEERVEDTLEGFTGEETVGLKLPAEAEFRSDYHTVYTAYYQGGRY